MQELFRFYLRNPGRLVILVLFGWLFSLFLYFVILKLWHLPPIYYFLSHLGLIWFFKLSTIGLALLFPIYFLSNRHKEFFQNMVKKVEQYWDLFLLYSMLYTLYHSFKSLSCGSHCYAYDDFRTSGSFIFFLILTSFVFLKRNLIKDEKGIHLHPRLRNVFTSVKEAFSSLRNLLESSFKTKSSSHEAIEKPVHRIASRKEFEYSIFYEDLPIGTVVIVDREKTSRGQDRIVGAAVHSNAAELRKNRELARKQSFQRNEDSRRSADVPGYQFLADRFNRVINGKKVFLWHRTHLIPFRHSLSEGDSIPNLLFAGTAHLNSGARPDINYVVEDGAEYYDSRDSRKDQLYQNFTLFEPLLPKKQAQKLYEEGESVYERYYAHIHQDKDISVAYAPEGSYYSLDDVEQTVDMIIRDYPKRNFVYATLLEYQNDSDLAPKWVRAMLIDKSSQALVFKIRLLNDL